MKKISIITLIIILLSSTTIFAASFRWSDVDTIETMATPKLDLTCESCILIEQSSR